MVFLVQTVHNRSNILLHQQLQEERILLLQKSWGIETNALGTNFGF